MTWGKEQYATTVGYTCDENSTMPFLNTTWNSLALQETVFASVTDRLFCKSNDGAIAAVNTYRLVETAKDNGLDLLKYLNFVLRRAPMADGNLTDTFVKSSCSGMKLSKLSADVAIFDAYGQIYAA